LNNYESSLNSSERIKELKKIELEIAKRNLENTLVKAPVDGIIEEVKVVKGDLVNQNTVVATLIDEKSIRVKTWIDEVDLKKVKDNAQVVVEFEQLSIGLEGRVKRIGPSAISAGGVVSIPLEITLKGGPSTKEIIPGLTCNIKVLLMDKKNVIVIPKNGLAKDNNGYYVMVKNGDSAEKRYVETGEITENVVEITSGLKEGEVVLLQPDKERLKQFIQEISGKAFPLRGVKMPQPIPSNKIPRR